MGGVGIRGGPAWRGVRPLYVLGSGEHGGVSRAWSNLKPFPRDEKCWRYSRLPYRACFRQVTGVEPEGEEEGGKHVMKDIKKKVRGPPSQTWLNAP